MQETTDFTPIYQRTIETDGFAIVPDVVSHEIVEKLRSAIENLDDREEVRRKSGIYGVRNALDVVPDVREMATSWELRSVVAPILGSSAFAVKGTLFDKVLGANWKLGWHQDNMITVRERLPVRGFVSWAQKAGVWHVEPPVTVLEQVLAVRIHLDDCGMDNGPLRVLPGSHRHGWIEHELPRWKAEVPEVVCEVSAGGIVAMRPLLLHASSSAVSPSHRRVLHIEYAAAPLPDGLEWHRALRFRA